MSTAATLPGYISGWRFNRGNYRTEIAAEAFSGDILPGFEDLSGYGNHMLLRQGAVAFEARASGGEGILLDNTNLFAAMNPILYDGSFVAVYQDGRNPSGAVPVIGFETFRRTRTKSGTSTPQPVMAFGRTNLGPLRFGNYHYNTASANVSPADGVRQVIAGAADMSVGRQNYSLRSAPNVADIDGAMNANVQPFGGDVVLGRLLPTQNDNARTAITGTQRLWISELHFFSNNLLKDYSDDLNAFMAQLAA